MNNLTQKHCEPCEGGIDPFTTEEIQKYNTTLSTPWDVIDNKKITRTFTFKNFKETMVFVNHVADLAEAEGHHPVMHVHYGNVKIDLWTHAIGGLSINDFIMAAKIELISN